jgi:NADH:ubiquinone oxidoreductase subunit 5 (subunit L)/multisubunit Na+/H+ antiporter MnhA subunit
LGFVANPQWVDIFAIPKHWITGFLADGLLASLGGEGHAETPDFSPFIAIISTGAALVGMVAALGLYLRRRWRPEPLELLGPVHTLLAQRYYIDHLYEGLLVRRGFYRIFAGISDWIDRRIVDGIVDLVGWFFRNIGSAIGRFQTGQVQVYGTAVAFGILLIILAFLLT